MGERVAVITGGARGIGRAIALSLAESGWPVAICYRTSGQEAGETVEAIREEGGRGQAVACDVSDPKAAEGLIRQVEKEWGRVDALVNCAGPYHRVELLEETVEGWHAMFDNNLHPVFYLSRAVAPGMMARKWGRIVSFSMATADQLVAQPQLTAHYIAKAGVLVLTRSLARVLAPHGITVNAISPGFIDSGSAPKEELAAMVKRIPAGYVGSTRDAVGVVRFLLSEEARYITGANIHLSGAWGI
ncbi:MAG: SDR family oxidoreductase [candidate division NC10 bacterium]|nr:SDR family oxidoreductase [candidate division NC10 bacterium]MBI4412868.1 SDR family oxidoreductase [candidate division NC10 bacterium]